MYTTHDTTQLYETIEIVWCEHEKKHLDPSICYIYEILMENDMKVKHLYDVL